MKKMRTVLHDLAKTTVDLYMLGGYTKADLMTDKAQNDITNEVTRYAGERNMDTWEELRNWVELYILDI